MFLIGVVAWLSRVVLSVHGACSLETVQGTTAVIAGHNDLVGVGGPSNSVIGDNRWPIAGQETLASVHVVLPEPPNFEEVGAGDCVDRDDRTLVGLDEPVR